MHSMYRAGLLSGARHEAADSRRRNVLLPSACQSPCPPTQLPTHLAGSLQAFRTEPIFSYWALLYAQDEADFVRDFQRVLQRLLQVGGAC